MAIIKHIAHGDARPTDNLQYARFIVYYRKELAQPALYPNYYTCTIPEATHVKLLAEFVHDYGGLPKVRRANS